MTWEVLCQYICLVWIVKRSWVLLELDGAPQLILIHLICEAMSQWAAHFRTHGRSDTSWESTLHSSQVLKLEALRSWTLSKGRLLSLMLHHHWHAGLDDHALVLLQWIVLTHQVLSTLVVILRKSASNLTTQTSCVCSLFTRIATVCLVELICAFSDMVCTLSNLQSICSSSAKHRFIISCRHRSLFLRSLRIHSSLCLN